LSRISDDDDYDALYAPNFISLCPVVAGLIACPNARAAEMFVLDVSRQQRQTVISVVVGSLHFEIATIRRRVTRFPKHKECNP
jgi:hypothetical protein